MPWPLEWYQHADDAARWAERAIPIERITAATYAVCGWQDFYVQGTVDYFNRLAAPKKLLMGPWKYVFPNSAANQPVNFLEIMIRWWDRWLRGKKNGIDDGPPITIFVQGSGVWRHEQKWPPRRNETRELYLAPQRNLNEQQPKEPCPAETYAYDPTVGLDSIGLDPWTTLVKEHGDHNADDARSLAFTSSPLPDGWELTGSGRVVIPIRASVAGLTFVAKLCDVSEDGLGTGCRVERGGLSSGGDSAPRDLTLLPSRPADSAEHRPGRLSATVANSGAGRVPAGTVYRLPPAPAVAPNPAAKTRVADARFPAAGRKFEITRRIGIYAEVDRLPRTCGKSCDSGGRERLSLPAGDRRDRFLRPSLQDLPDEVGRRRSHSQLVLHSDRPAWKVNVHRFDEFSHS